MIIDDNEIIEIIEILRSKLRKVNISSKRDVNLSAPRFVFVCGKKIEESQKTIRSHTIEQLKKYTVTNAYNTKNEVVLCIVSENLYVQDLAEDIFTFEKMLAEISDVIIIVTESPGTFCELGAFVMDDECRKKTIVINQDKEEFKESFITKGPIKMLQNDDDNSVILHAGLEWLKDSAEYKCRLDQIAKRDLIIDINNNSKEVALKSLIYELANIIEIFQPLEGIEIELLYKRIKGFDGYTIKNTSGHKIKNIKQVLNLMVKMGMLKNENCYYLLNRSISCYNTMFTLSRKEFNDIRIAYYNRMEKLQLSRMKLLYETK